MSFSGKTVLVTGAGGFIGSHLAERLVELGAQVRAFVHYNALGEIGWLRDSTFLDEMEIIAGDVRDRDSVRQAVRGTDVVFHLAALIGIPYSYHAPDSYIRTNVDGTLNILCAARDLGVQRVVHTSTSEVYGTARYVPIDEQHPLQCQSPYSASKSGADKLAEAFHCSFGVPVVTVRPFNTFGPRQSARAVIPTIITQCLADGVIRLGDLRPVRDFTYVSDTVDGFVLAGARDAAVGRTINVGVGRGTCIGEVAELAARLAGGSSTVETEPERFRPERSEVMRLVADNSLARSLLGWGPAVGLEDGLQRTIEWTRAHMGMFRTGCYVV